LAIALLVVAIMPASALAANNTLRSELTIPGAVMGQGGIAWVPDGTFTGTFNAFYNDSPYPNAAFPDVHGFAYWVDGGPGQFVPDILQTDGMATVNFDLSSIGVHTIIHSPDTTQTGSPPDPYEPATTDMIGVDSGGNVLGGNPVWHWTLSPPDPGGVIDSPDPAGWYGNTQVTFLATASDPGGSGIANAMGEWRNLTTSTAFPASPPAMINLPCYPTDGKP
jgi:hypothetical protein